ncbi:MAG: hypothetical protein H7322_09055 [Ramlibacter sp.]|nr:hypothetical protein [Ramlibacter sp.]
MTSFVQVARPTQHPGVARAERAADSIKQVAHRLLSPRGVATLLLAAIVSALLVVANQVVDSRSEGHLLLAWITMWTIAFAALALAARPVRSAVNRARVALREAAIRHRAAVQDEAMWRLALTDARVMADISRAMSSDAAKDVLGARAAPGSRYEWGRGL